MAYLLVLEAEAAELWIPLLHAQHAPAHWEDHWVSGMVWTISLWETAAWEPNPLKVPCPSSPAPAREISGSSHVQSGRVWAGGSSCLICPRFFLRLAPKAGALKRAI